MKDEYIEFEEYGKVVLDAIKNITHDYNMGDGPDKVQVIYATPPVAFAKFSQETQNGKKPGPLISFYLSSIEVNPEEQMGGYATLLINDGKTRIKAPVIAKLTYTVDINAIKESQADLLQSQIMLAMPFNHPYATTLNGQWVCIVSDNFENQTTIELETDKDKVSKRQLSITIKRAYLNHPFQTNDKFIKGLNLSIYSIGEKNGNKK